MSKHWRRFVLILLLVVLAGYLNLSDGMKRAGGEEWKQWHTKITKKIVDLQNNDGTWAGHHCITGRVAVTSAAMLNLTVNRAD